MNYWLKNQNINDIKKYFRNHNIEIYKRLKGTNSWFWADFRWFLVIFKKDIFLKIFAWGFKIYCQKYKKKSPKRVPGTIKVGAIWYPFLCSLVGGVKEYGFCVCPPQNLWLYVLIMNMIIIFHKKFVWPPVRGVWKFEKC